MAVDRMVATSRLKVFFKTWMEENWEEDKKNVHGTRGISLLAFRAGVQTRAVTRVLTEEVPNISFNFVDKVFTNLDCVHLWHMKPEHGGFSDYYQDEAPERVPETAEQTRFRIEANARKSGKLTGRDWLDVLHEKALEEVAA